ncbi:MAG: cellulosome anchor protein [Bacillota bacterium]
MSGLTTRRSRVSLVLAAAAIAVLAASMAASGQGSTEAGDSPNLEVRNHYIKIFVNRTDDATARYAVDSTGGDPLNPGDDNKPLVYGHPRPWTSYTTIRVDGVDYVFGGKTERRAGKGANYGVRVSGPELSGRESIVATWRFGDIEVSQVLSIVRSTTTGLHDTARITYIVTNQGSVEHAVGARVMLDTMLGANDGAPFRAKDKAILSDMAFGSSDMPHFWQAFDSLSNPSVTSQGTLAGADATPPDRVIVTNWGSLADGVWDVDFVPGRDFTRAGEYELDSAIALYWDPAPLAPGDSREYTTLYGMGGISIAPGVLSIGVTSPAEVTCGKDRPATFPIVAYVENSGPTVALNVRIALELPGGLTLVSGKQGSSVLGDLAPGQTAQVAWEVAPEVRDQAEFRYSVAVEAENAERNRVHRAVRVLAPPKLAVKIQAPPGFAVRGDEYDPYPLKLKAIIKNMGGAPAYGVKTTLALSQGLGLAPREKASKFPGQVAPGETCEMLWQVVPTGEIGSFDYMVKVTSRSTEDTFASAEVRVPELLSRVLVVAPAVPLKSGQFFTVEVLARNLKGLQEAMFDLRFDALVLEAISVSRGTVFVEEMAMPYWREGVIDNSSGLIGGVGGRLTKRQDVSGVLAYISFRAKAPGECRIALENVLLKGDPVPAISSSLGHATVTVVE